MTAEPNTIEKPKRLPGRLRAALPCGAEVWAYPRRDLGRGDLYGWACACGKEVRYWRASRGPKGKLLAEDVTDATLKALRARAVQARISAHARHQRRRRQLVKLAARDALRWQEQNAPTAPVFVRLTAYRNREQARRRILDARLWNNLTGFEQDAARCIAIGHELVTAGLGQKCQKFQPRELSMAAAQDARYRPLSYGQQQLVDHYIDWTRRAEKGNVVVDAVLEVLAHNRSCSAVDKARRRQNGWARRNLGAGLQIYCRLRGWPTTL